jgi:hypothetical protein
VHTHTLSLLYELLSFPPHPRERERGERS